MSSDHLRKQKLRKYGRFARWLMNLKKKAKKNVDG
jgi:hypothetical protein